MTFDAARSDLAHNYQGNHAGCIRRSLETAESEVSNYLATGNIHGAAAGAPQPLASADDVRRAYAEILGQVTNGSSLRSGGGDPILSYVAFGHFLSLVDRVPAAQLSVLGAHRGRLSVHGSSFEFGLTSCTEDPFTAVAKAT